uniref:ENT domain-containing protein n=1 Tax=Davidia involucrata TaxID=16924 RepID=A0A5B7BTR0_DAVIN
MDYSNHDGIGTHRNLPVPYINNSLRVNTQGIARMLLTTDYCGVESQIHSIETEAYGAVLRAFISQSDVLSWGKEGLITELRKELNVTDHEHRKLLTKIDSDESVRMIREWRKGTSHAQESLSSKMNAPDFVLSSVGDDPHKILKTSHAPVSALQKYVSHSQIQPTSAAVPSSLPVQVRNNRLTGELRMYPTKNPGKLVTHNIPAPAVSKHGGPVKYQSKKGFHGPAVGNFRKRFDLIEIRATDKLMHEVERMVYGQENSDPDQVERAKSILRDHERAILEALVKLSDVSDGDDSLNQLHHHYSAEELPRIGRGMATHDFYSQLDNRLRRIPYIVGQDDEATPSRVQM